MKNTIVLIFAVSILFTFALGCGITERLKKSVGVEQTNTNTSTPPSDSPEKTETTETNSITPDGEKIGIPQCDEVYEMLTEQMNPKEDESYISKAGKEFYLNEIRKMFRESIKNEKDHDKLAENCSQLLEQLKKHKAEEDGKK